MALDANGHLLETTVSKHLNSGCCVKCDLSIPSKGSVEPSYGESGPGNATRPTQNWALASDLVPGSPGPRRPLPVPAGAALAAVLPTADLDPSEHRRPDVPCRPRAADDAARRRVRCGRATRQCAPDQEFQETPGPPPPGPRFPFKVRGRIGKRRAGGSGNWGFPGLVRPAAALAASPGALSQATGSSPRISTPLVKRRHGKETRPGEVPDSESHSP